MQERECLLKLVFNMIFGYIRRTDKWLWASCLSVCTLSVTLLYGILKSGHALILEFTLRNLIVQSGAIILGVVAAIVLSLIDYHTLVKWWKLHVSAAYFLVFLTFIIGVGVAPRLEDKRWLIMPIVGISVQPAEFLKISFILIFAYHLAKVGEGINKPVHLAPLCAHALFPVILVHVQGDSGTALLFLTISASMMFVSGLHFKYVGVAGAGLVLSTPVIWRYILSPFQRERILTLLNQATANPVGDYYQQYQAKLAAGVGGITGVGLVGDSHVYVPEMHNDFIFSFLSESFGFIGAAGLLGLMVFICFRILYNARASEDRVGMLICTGVCAMILFQFVINIGMCLSLMPVIGNTFPFLSYGGSSMLTNFLGIGLVLSVHMQRKRGQLFMV